MLLLGSMLGGGISPGRAQEPAPAPAPAAKPKQAYVRFWNMLPGDANEVVELLAAENKPLSLAAPSNYYADYLPVTPGPYTFIVRRRTDAANPLKRLPVNLPADAYVTILVSAKDGQPTVEGINDTIDPKTSGDASRLVVRQFMAGARVTASVGTAPPTPVLNAGETATLDNLPAAQVVVNVQATFANAPAKSWVVPVDFSSNHHGTLLVVADRYGRFRPRFATDGHAVTGASSGAPH